MWIDIYKDSYGNIFYINIFYNEKLYIIYDILIEEDNMLKIEGVLYSLIYRYSDVTIIDGKKVFINGYHLESHTGIIDIATHIKSSS